MEIEKMKLDATVRPVAHRLTLDPCGLAYSLLRPAASTPKVVPLRAGQPGSVRNLDLIKKHKARHCRAFLFLAGTGLLRG